MRGPADLGERDGTGAGADGAGFQARSARCPLAADGRRCGAASRASWRLERGDGTAGQDDAAGGEGAEAERANAVSPWRTEICAGSMRSSCAAICARVVSMPWPWLWMPTRSCSVPSGIMRAVLVSYPGTTRDLRRVHSAVPWPLCSV